MRPISLALLLVVALLLTACQSVQAQSAIPQPIARSASATSGTDSPPGLGRLAYVQDGDIWVKSLPDGEPERLTEDGQ